MALRLRPLRDEDEAVARRAHAELAVDDFEFLLDWESGERWRSYLVRLENRRHGIDLPPDRVRGAFLVAVAGSEIVGRVSIRFELNEFLENFGGHVGYCVRPGHRRQGFAREILRQALVIARAEGVDRVLVTCDEDNLPSARAIEANAGVLEDIRAEPDGTDKRRYWID
jgi:predicted acetyltransferase